MMFNIYVKQCVKFSTLDDVMKSNGDCFALFRLFAAFLVLYAHAYHIFGLGSDPLTRITGVYTGTLAVYVFFSISGFFIIKSAIDRNILQFFIARIARIYPALIVCNILTVMLIIPLASDFNWLAFISLSETTDYIKINSILDTLKFTITGVFDNNPDPAINGSLWTLPVEIRAYIMALFLVMVGVTTTTSRFNACLVTAIFINYKYPDVLTTLFPIPGSASLLLYFLFGSALYINKKFIPISPILLVVSVVTIICNRNGFSPVLLSFLIVYTVISSGYLCSKIVSFKLDNDYSYGCYLYAYPLSQLSFVLFAGISFSAYFIFVVISTILFSVFSWHYIEKPINVLARTIILLKLKLLIHKIRNI